MGVGKTTIGRRLAPLIDLPFHDADEAVEEAAGMKVADFFQTHGETAFRDGEARVIKRLLDALRWSSRPVAVRFYTRKPGPISAGWR